VDRRESSLRTRSRGVLRKVLQASGFAVENFEPKITVSRCDYTQFEIPVVDRHFFCFPVVADNQVFTKIKIFQIQRIFSCRKINLLACLHQIS